MGGSHPAGKVVLIVEDEAIIRMLLTDYLEDEGYIVREASNADAALAFLGRGEAVDAIVTDVRMPGTIDGIGLMAWVREHRASLPCVVTTGYVTEQQAKAANPAALIVSKPYSPGDMVAVLRNLIG